jgi:hypothetical protein
LRNTAATPSETGAAVALFNAVLTANERSMPQIGRDLVKIGCTYGGLLSSCGDIRARVTRKGTADERNFT